LTALQCLNGASYARLDPAARRAYLDRVLAIIAPANQPNGRAAHGGPTRSTLATRPALAGAVEPASSRAALGRLADAPSLSALQRAGVSPLPPASPPRRATGRAKGGSAAGAKPAGVAGQDAARTAPKRRPATARPLAPDDPVTRLPRIGAGRAAALERLGIVTLRDLLFHLPHRYDDFSRIVPIARLVPGEQATIVGRVWSANAVQIGRNFQRKSSELVVGDESGNVRVLFFNNPYPAQQLRTNDRVTLSGKAGLFHGRPQLESPEWEVVEPGSALESAVHTGRLVPVYPL